MHSTLAEFAITVCYMYIHSMSGSTIAGKSHKIGCILALCCGRQCRAHRRCLVLNVSGCTMREAGHE